PAWEVAGLLGAGEEDGGTNILGGAGRQGPRRKPTSPRTPSKGPCRAPERKRGGRGGRAGRGTPGLRTEPDRGSRLCAVGFFFSFNPCCRGSPSPALSEPGPHGHSDRVSILVWSGSPSPALFARQVYGATAFEARTEVRVFAQAAAWALAEGWARAYAADSDP